MPSAAPITRDGLLALEAYERWRALHRAGLIGLRRLRSVQLGGHLRLQFENAATVRYQLQEMLRAGRIVDDARIEEEILAYAPLVPAGDDWTATLLLEYPDPAQRRRELARLAGVEDRVFVEAGGGWRVHAQADEDLDRRPGDGTRAVHFLRFRFSTAQVRDLRQPGAAVVLGCDHVHAAARAHIPSATLASLLADLG